MAPKGGQLCVAPPILVSRPRKPPPPPCQLLPQRPFSYYADLRPYPTIELGEAPAKVETSTLSSQHKALPPYLLTPALPKISEMVATEEMVAPTTSEMVATEEMVAEPKDTVVQSPNDIDFAAEASPVAVTMAMRWLGGPEADMPCNPTMAMQWLDKPEANIPKEPPPPPQEPFTGPYPRPPPPPPLDLLPPQPPRDVPHLAGLTPSWPNARTAGPPALPAGPPGQPPPASSTQGDIPNVADQWSLGRKMAREWNMGQNKEIHPEDLTKTKLMRWRWVGECRRCGFSEVSDWGAGEVDRIPGCQASGGFQSGGQEAP